MMKPNAKIMLIVEKNNQTSLFVHCYLNNIILLSRIFKLSCTQGCIKNTTYSNTNTFLNPYFTS
ncbi:unnamed protein product [Paramecium pentaurelia]|uniref:Uncharacterized protein n=1 Tax=Paramecium pentaurelia TaxID=43138 RepID=A0A8S1WKB3_9CILI|nr:unnamed protein product [Paramecium pentaurelia]